VQISTDKTVSFHYQITDANNVVGVLESSFDSEPTLYLHGYQNILPSFEDALEGKTIGEKLELTLSLEQAYGVGGHHH